MKLVIGENDIKTCYPNLMTEWNYDRNSVNPSHLTRGSHKKVWWKCNKCGMDWQAEIHSRVAGNGCPFCKGDRISKTKSIVKEGNSLQDKYPHIAALWHPEKNGGMIPSLINAGTNRKFWWKCSLGHEWESRVSNTLSSNGRCPICMKELGTSFPEQTVFYYLSKHFYCISRWSIEGKEIDIYIPDRKIGIEYDGRYYHSNRREADNKKQYDLQRYGISLYRIVEADQDTVCDKYITFEQYSSRKESYFHLQWAIEKLLQMLDVQVEVNELDIDRDATRIYSQYIVSRKTNSLAVLFPDIAKEWDYDHNESTSPEMFVPGSHKMVWWICEKGHHYKATIKDRVRYYKEKKVFACPYCSGHKVLKGFNDLLSVNPEIAKDWHYEKNDPLLPSEVTAGSHRRVWWRCRKCGNEWQSTVSNRKNGRGCPMCKWSVISNKLASKNTDSNNLLDKCPNVAKEWDYNKNDGIFPNQFAPHSNKKVWWKCGICGFEWIASINNRVNGTGCPNCAKKGTGQRCRLSHAEFAMKMQKYGNPNVILLGEYETSSSKILCRCSLCGNKWETTPRSLLRGAGCPKCRVNRRSIIVSKD